MNLKIGILGKTNGWKLLLQQIGLPYGSVNGSPGPNDFSVIVAGDDLKNSDIEKLRQYIRRGGAVLCSVKVLSRIRPMKMRSKYIKYFSGRNSVFDRDNIVDIGSGCWFPRSSDDLNGGRGVLSAYTGMEMEYVVALPFDAGELVLDSRAVTKTFYSSERRLPFEKVSLVSKSEIRALVSDSLEFLHHRRGLPYVHLWYFPNGAPSIFCFRIDTDYGTKLQVNDLYRVVSRNRIPATWFIDLKSQERILELYKRMKEQELGVHCYEHVTFEDYVQNAANIRKARTVLKNSGIKARGFAAPFGKWNNELGRVILESGFEYSSEFSYDYDNMPGTPFFDRNEGVLQIPVHPICIGSLKRHSYNENQMTEYFRNVLERKLVLPEPAIFYHHPGDGNLNVLDRLFKEIKERRIPVKSMGDYAKWWKNRIVSLKGLKYTNGKICPDTKRGDKSVYIRITRPNGTQALVPVSGKIDMKKIKWNRKPPVFNLPDDYKRIRAFNYRIPLIRTLDTAMNFIGKLSR